MWATSCKTWQWPSIYAESVNLTSSLVSQVSPRFCVWTVCNWVSAVLSPGQWSYDTFVVLRGSIEKSQTCRAVWDTPTRCTECHRARLGGPHWSLPYRCSTNIAHWSEPERQLTLSLSFTLVYVMSPDRHLLKLSWRRGLATLFASLRS